MKKTALLIILSLMTSPVFAKGALRGAGDNGGMDEVDCNPSTEYCVLIKGDSSLTTPVTALIKEDAVIKRYFQTNSFEKEISFHDDGVYLNGADVQLLRAKHVTYINAGVFKINGKPISNCYFSVSGKVIPPGLHTLIISKTDSGYTCHKS